MAQKEDRKPRSERGAGAAANEHGAPSGTATGKRPLPTAAAPSTGEEDFPRGGSDGLTALERREAMEAAQREVERELAEGKVPKAKKPKLSNKGRGGKGGDEDDEALLAPGPGAAAGLEGKLAKHVEVLRAKNLHVGTRLWGMVLEVTPRGLVVSLPYGMRGTVAPEQASDVLALMLKGGSNKKAAALIEAAGGAVPPLTDLFAVGQYVRCVVAELREGGKQQQEQQQGGGGGAARSSRHVCLSLLLKDVQGALGAEGLADGVVVGACVRSVEDHGYTLSFGIKGTSGFLRKRDHEAQFGEGVVLQVGGLLDVCIKNAADKRNVLVSCAPGEVAAAVTRADGGAAGGPGLDSLLPGALLNVKVYKVLSNGLLVSFFTFLHGTIDLQHLPPASPDGPAAAANSDWRKQYTEGAKLRARLLYVDPTTKRAGLSLLPHLMTWSLPSPVPMLGSVFPDAEVQRVDLGGPGLLMRLPGLPEGPVPAYCHVSNALEPEGAEGGKEGDKKGKGKGKEKEGKKEGKEARDAAVAELNSKFKPGTRISARVIGYRLMDGLASVTVRPSQVNAAVLSMSDLAPGAVVAGTVTAVPSKSGEGVVVVTVAEGVRGIVPPLHAAEATGSGGPGRVKVKVGDKVEARVWEVDAGARKLVLSLRKALLTPKTRPLVAREQAALGAKFHGVITGLHDQHGVYVQFCNGLSGLAPHSELGLGPGQVAKEVFTVGQVVKATIVNVAPNGRIKLSLSSKAANVAAAAATDPAAAAAAATAAAGAADPLGGLQPGDIAEAVVVEMQEAAAGAPGGTTYVCRLEVAGAAGGGVRARLDAAHLSDHPAAVAAFREVVRAGSKLGRVLVLERMEAQRCVRVSRKPSLLAAAAAGQLPRRFEDVAEAAVVPGFVASVTHDAVYVRFLGGLTGRAGLAQLSDVFVSDPRVLFAEGQSVRCVVATVDAAKQRFTLGLKPSATASTDASYLLDYFTEMALLQAMRAEQEPAAANGDSADASDPTRAFPPGCVVLGTVHEVKEYGIVCDMDKHPDVVGLVPSSHTGLEQGQGQQEKDKGKSKGKSKGKGKDVDSRGQLLPGDRVVGVVLDVVPHQGLVELSLKEELKRAAKDGKGLGLALKRLEVGTQVEAVVEGVRPGEYLILSLPSNGHLLAYAAVTDYNTPQPEHVSRTFTPGQRLTATVQVLPRDAPGGRMLCHVPLTRETAAPVKGAKAGDGSKGGPKVDLTPGTLVQVVVTAIQPHQLDVTVGGKVNGRIHVTEVADVDAKALLAAAAGGVDKTAPPAAKKARKEAAAAAVAANGAGGAAGKSPLDGFRLQQTLEAVVLGRLLGGEGHKHGVLDLSLRPSRLQTARKGEPQVPTLALGDLVPGQQLVCHVLEAGEDALWLGAGPAVRGRCAALDASLDPDALTNLASAFPPGTPVVARVLAVAAKKQHPTLDLSLIDPCSGTTHGSVAGAAAHPEGSLAMGKVLGVAGTGVRLSLGTKRAAKVAVTDIHDVWVEDALAGIKEGVYVRCRVVGKDGEVAVASLRPSKGGAVAGRKGEEGREKGKDKGGKGKEAAQGEEAPELVDVGKLAAGQEVCGYVKRCDAKGLFVALDRFRDARVKLGNLSDGFIEDPAAAFPPGMRVKARVLKVDDDGRVELTFRSPRAKPSGSRVQSLSELKVGQVVAGRVRRAEKFGVFVEVEGNSSVVGLAHISELLDGPVKDINSLFQPKQSVRAVVTKVDTEAGRLSLSLKPSALAAAEAAAAEGEGGKGAKRKRAKDIDDEMVEAADEEEEEEEGKGTEEEGDSDGEEEGSEGEGEEGLEGVDVDDVDVSEEEGDDEEDGDADAMEEDGSGGSGSEEEEEEQGGEDDDDEGEEEDEEDGRANAGQGAASAPGLDLTAPGAWGELLLLQDDPRVAGGAGQGGAAAAEGGEGAERKGLTKGQKKRLKEQHEQAIRAAELARLSGSAAPSTPADYERLALASPSSSFVWIKYMAFHISLGDIDAARKVAQRALDTINYREEGEKFNVWVAWLNLETAYGTQPSPEEAAMGLLRRALQYTDQKKMYLAALGIFERAGRDELADQVVKPLTKKFGSSCKVWARALERALTKGDSEGAPKLLERALQSLPQRKHVKLLVRAALAEFRLGSAERGRGVLEGVLRNHPKRLDLWNVYIDQELKTGEQQRIRALFERATHLPLPPKKMKFLFRRYLEYEKSEGDAAAVEHVKRRAMEFVEQSLKA